MSESIGILKSGAKGDVAIFRLDERKQACGITVVQCVTNKQ
ncbi:MAG: hypothetical protein NWE87_00025 [Candidatus Bathyarchaeota archaeon]|nr:hypothetical protein [Candidatus Bathyarchaeota archaeon]